ncbi:unnamed protein product [Adineta steineri]|uniref:Uncharacterized protein n=1 Tax=Adineta steineri TaxID=433720 RepID=A0A818HFT3_9BILA|nr:unnamed protein product [Adineta steineri]CAF1210433.1 unnamed protein product [Adineta steineri]CAF3507421.1 unnamed protein product [Adineta steineri]CAF3609882.1 unnamed protein product [Adineta steineri]
MIAVRQVILVCFLLALIQLSDGLTCYTCAGCNDPFNKENVATQTVSDNSGYSCTKIKAENIVGRGLIQNCQEINAAGQGTWCCQKDLCNTATKTVLSTTILFSIIPAILTRLF